LFPWSETPLRKRPGKTPQKRLGADGVFFWGVFPGPEKPPRKDLGPMVFFWGGFPGLFWGVFPEGLRFLICFVMVFLVFFLARGFSGGFFRNASDFFICFVMVYVVCLGFLGLLGRKNPPEKTGKTPQKRPGAAV
jgi:hypothetical protein